MSSTPAAVPATERLADETTEVQRSSSDPSLGSSRRKRRKTHPHPASDVYVSEFSPTDKAGGRLARDLKDPQVVSAKQAFYEKLATVLILSDGSGLGDCVVLQKTKNEKLIEMSPFTALVDHFPKQMRMPEGSFRVIVNAQFSDNQGNETKKCWRPRIHGAQVNVMQEVRYPTSEQEWAGLREVLMSAQDGFGSSNIRLLDDDIDVDHVMAAVKEAAQKARDFKAIYDDKLRESMDPARSARLGFKQDQAPAPMNRTEMIGLEHADDDEEGLQNIVPRNIELHVDSKVFVTTTATLLASPEGCWFRHMISSFPNAQEFYVDRSPAVFEWVLEYLRELRYMNADDDRAGVTSLPLPSETLALLQLRRECDFYGLPELHALVENRLQAQRGD